MRTKPVVACIGQNPALKVCYKYTHEEGEFKMSATFEKNGTLEVIIFRNAHERGSTPKLYVYHDKITKSNRTNIFNDISAEFMFPPEIKEHVINCIKHYDNQLFGTEYTCKPSKQTQLVIEQLYEYFLAARFSRAS